MKWQSCSLRWRTKVVYCHFLWFCHNPTMMKTIVELLQATVLAALFFGPLFYYFLFVMQP
jgi:hypothetical protein